MILYIESSAVLAWLLAESNQLVAQRTLGAAKQVVSSSLTAVECARALVFAGERGRINRTQEFAALRLLDVAERSWQVLGLTDDVLARARTRLPIEPVRALDALHLATAMILREALGPISLLSFDNRIRANAEALGLEVLPALSF